jgi:amidase
MSMTNDCVVERDVTQTAYMPKAEPVLRVTSGTTVEFRTHDTRSGALLDMPRADPYDLPKPDRSRGNPISGPVFVEGARPSDGLLVEVLSIVCDPVGWCGAHAGLASVPPGRVSQARGRTCEVTESGVQFGPNLSVPVQPMIGCIGTAPLADLSTQLAGAHGGNMDQSVVRAGTAVLLPVFVDGALLSIGDVHAAQGDGELAGLALEIPACVTVRVRVVTGRDLSWPWLRSAKGVSVMTAAGSFEAAAALATDEGIKLLEDSLALSPADALALLSITSDIRVGAAWGGPQTTVRLEIPAHLGVAPAGLRAR